MQNASVTLEYSLYLHLYSENLGGEWAWKRKRELEEWEWRRT